MIDINASLFAHIENDAHLSGTYKLQGNYFSNTARYLKAYLLKLQQEDEFFPPDYLILLKNMESLVATEKELRQVNTSGQILTGVNRLGKKLAKQATQLKPGEKIFIPGGWLNQDGGHAMVYELTRTTDGFHLTAINAGGGLEYHDKKSERHKELYYPAKTWHFPYPESSKEENELGLFITRLLKTNTPNAPDRKKPVTAQILYEQILPSISFIGGKEIPSTSIVNHAWTGGQLSGTCSQRCLHQMLKLNSPSLLVYEQFIFKFKQHALLDYSKACLEKKQPLTKAVGHQIHLAINNNLKILKKLKGVTPKEKEQHLKQLLETKEKITNAVLTLSKKTSQPKKKPAQTPTIDSHYPITAKPWGNASMHEARLPNPPHFDLKTNFSNLGKIIDDVQKINSPAIQYHYLKELILQLPIALNQCLTGQLKTLADYQTFEKQIDDIQKLLINLQKNWIKKKQIPLMNAMTLSIMSLQMEIKSSIAEQTGLPSFKPFVSYTLNTLLGNNARNPFWATNHPQFDEKINQLQKRFEITKSVYHLDFYKYLKELLQKEPALNQDLQDEYNRNYSTNTTSLHEKIRDTGLGALFLISEHIKHHSNLPSTFYPIIKKIRTHLEYEQQLREAINPFFKDSLSEHLFLDFDTQTQTNELFVYSPLYASFISWQRQTNAITHSKYNLQESPAKTALEQDVSEYSRYKKPIITSTANGIQLKPGHRPADEKTITPVTQEDIEARDYFHLRSNPQFQVDLTLDYFTGHIDKLATETNQRYMEANLFQPGLLKTALLSPTFLPRFDEFLNTGFRFFNQNGQCTQPSLFYFRLNYLVSQYIYLNHPATGLERLKTLQSVLEKQLSLPNTPNEAYVLQQTLFLTIMTQIELGQDPKEQFDLAFKAYFDLQRHTDPQILSDFTHHTEVDAAIAKFQILAAQQPEHKINKAIDTTLKAYPDTAHYRLTTGQFPFYTLEDSSTHKTVEFNVMRGKLFEQQLAKSGLPLPIKNHPLLKHLGLQDEELCLISANQNYIILTDKTNEVRLYSNPPDLGIQKDWVINKQKKAYELKALSSHHEACLAHSKNKPITHSLPAILTDKTFDYWSNVNTPSEGLLVQNNRPVYSIKNNEITQLDNKGNETPFKWIPLDPRWQSVINPFESHHFILTHANTNQTIIHLPRYHLSFEVKSDTLNPGLFNQDTGEQVIECPSPIHPSVASLVLANGQHRRCLVPVSRFYATEEGAEDSDYYPVVHDTENVIPQASLEQEWTKKPPLKKPLWDHHDSQKHISFSLRDGEPVADNAADALYLAYIYLATNQTKKAWQTLEDCATRLGGLTGNPDELKHIAWICKDLPHKLPGTKEDASRETPADVACQLKAIGLVCDHLLQDRPFDLKKPTENSTANSQHALIEHNDLNEFLKTLPQSVYTHFSRYQTMGRHLEHAYQLSTIERKRLLDYYQTSQPQKKPPLGALGYEWSKLSLEALEQEKNAIQARAKTSNYSQQDVKRLAFINKHMQQQQPIISKSTTLELLPIDLTLPVNSLLNFSQLPQKTETEVGNWSKLFPKTTYSKEELQVAVDKLSSDISESDFITDFPTYFHLARNNTHPHLQKNLIGFCANVLIANRHLPLNKQSSNLPLLCNILYRVTHEKKFIFIYTTFNALVHKVSPFSPPPLSVYQAQDVFSEILAKPEDILTPKNADTPKQLILPSLNKTALSQNDVIQKTLQSTQSKQKASFYDLIASFKTLQQQEAKQLLAASTEEEAAKCLFDSEEQQKKLAMQFITNQELIEFVENIANTVAPQLLKQGEDTWEIALKLANEGPEDPEQAETWAIEKHAAERPQLNKSHLLSLYCRSDAAYIIELTGLSLHKAKQLHELIHLALFQDIQSQLIQNVSKHLEKAKKSHNPNHAMPILDILSRENTPGLENPATTIIQHEEDILLRTRQVSAIQSLLKTTPDTTKQFNQTIEKIIPGGGKSKVILPVVAENKAHGDNLVVLEVPQALLATNHADLNRTSQRLFGKKAYLFEFNRDSNSSPERLEQIYKQCVEIITTRSYMVTSGDAIQSLELKYIELLLAKEKGGDWEKQMYWCDKIMILFHHYADCLIDEVHQGLWLKKKLNYTSGEQKSINPGVIKNTIALFDYIETDFIQKARDLDNHYDWTAFKTQLATQLIHDPQSPLMSFVSTTCLRYGDSVKKDLVNYLMNSTDTVSEAIVNATPEEKEKLALFKQQVSVLMPETLRRKLDVHYGASKIKNRSPAEYALAIPYNGNDNPSEGSRFGNEIEAMNYTIQMMLINGISKELLKQQLIKWQALARQELIQNQHFKHLDETPTARGFALLEKKSGVQLSEVNVNNDQQMEQIHARQRHNRSLINRLLEEQILGQITQDSKIIPSDAINHVDIYRSVQGVSGTPGNYLTYHQKLQYDPKTSLGTDDYIFEVLKNKNTEVKNIDYESTAQFIQMTLTHSKSHQRLRAIIDINATFKGVKNIQVATELALFIKKNPKHFSHSIRHVLYFNDDQVLCALDVNNLDKITALGTSEEKELSRILNSKPEERFTYYSQIHTLGTDIKQAEDAHAIVLTDEKDSCQASRQGKMRMRELSQKQTIEIIVPQRIKGISFEELVKQQKENDKNELLLEKLNATKAQMSNYFRRLCLNEIQNIPSEEPEKKAQLATILQQVLIDIPNTNLFSVYGAISKKKAVKSILNDHKQKLINTWNACCQEIKLSQTHPIETELQTIIQKALPDCLEEYDSTDDTFAKEVQIQKEVQKEIQVERIELNACYDPNHTEVTRKPWPKINTIDELINPKETKNLMLLSANEAVNVGENNPSAIFSNHFHLSCNYSITHHSQTNFLNVYLKPVFLVWYHLENNALHATVITPQEAENLANKIITDTRHPHSWISTTSDTVVEGKRPDAILNDPIYQSLREQVRFFNGEFTQLLNQTNPLIWLKDDALAKMDLYQNKLQPYRPGSDIGFAQLKASLTQGNIDGFLYIAQNPYVDLTAFNWKSIFPKTIPTQAAEYKKLAEAFVYLNQHWATENLSLEAIQNTFSLPMNSLTYLADHQKFLVGLKELIKKITPNLNQLLFTDLPPEDKETLEKILGVSIDDFYARHGVNPKDTSNEQQMKWQMANIDSVHLLMKVPVLQKHPLFISYLEQMIQKAQSPKALLLILKTDHLPPSLLTQIANNPCCNESVIQRLLDWHEAITEELLIELLLRCETEESMKKIILHPKSTPELLNLALNHPQFSTEIAEQLLSQKMNEFSIKQVKAILLKITQNQAHLSEKAINNIINHPHVDDELFETILHLNQNQDFSEETLLFMSNKSTNESTINQLLKRKEVEANERILQTLLNNNHLSEEHLLTILSLTKNSETLLFIYNHDAADAKTHQMICNHSLLQPKQLLTLLNSSKLTDEELLLLLENKNAIDADGLNEIIHPDIQTKTLQKIVLHPLVTPALLLKILQNCRHVDISVLQMIPQDKINRDVQIKMLVHQKATGELVNPTITHPDFSLEAAMILIEKYSNSLNQSQFTTITTKIFSEKIKTIPVHIVLTTLNHTSCTPNELEAILNHPTAITCEVLSALIDKKNIQAATFNQIASHQQTTWEIIEKMILHQLLSASTALMIWNQYTAQLNAQHLDNIVRKMSNENHFQIPDKTLLALLTSPLCTPSMVKDLQTYLTKPPANQANQPLLLAMAKQCKTSLLAENLLKMQAADGQVLQELLKQEALDEKNLLTILEKTTDPEVIAQVYQHPTTKNHQTIKDSVYKHPFTSSSILKDLLSKHALSAKELLMILNHPTAIDPPVLQAIIDQKSIDEAVLKVLFNKPRHYDVLEKTLKKLENNTRKQWLLELKTTHDNMQKNAMDTKNPETMFNVAINALKVKAYTHAIKALRNEAYKEVAQAAVTLHHALSEETEKNRLSHPDVFKKNCEKAFSDAKPVLGTHRGYKQILTDILNVILAVITLKWTQFGSGKWRFFEPKTNSLQLAEDIEKTIKKANN